MLATFRHIQTPTYWPPRAATQMSYFKPSSSICSRRVQPGKESVTSAIRIATA